MKSLDELVVRTHGCLRQRVGTEQLAYLTGNNYVATEKTFLGPRPVIRYVFLFHSYHSNYFHYPPSNCIWGIE